MKSTELFPGVLFAVSWLSLPSFDLQTALIVTGVAFGVLCVCVFCPAWIFPVVAAAGASKIGVVIGLAVASCLIGAAAGLTRGYIGDIRHREQIDSIKRVSNQLEIRFERSTADPKRAADFQCTLVVYEETDLTSRQPTVTTRTTKISGANSDEFYGQVDQQMRKWLAKQVSGDSDGQPRRILIYMIPYPGEGIYERLKQMAEKSDVRRCVVNKIEGAWTSALPQ